MSEPCGTVAIVLHSHIPYVLGHNQLEEEWLFEAVAESYLPPIQLMGPTHTTDSFLCQLKKAKSWGGVWLVQQW